MIFPATGKNNHITSLFPFAARATTFRLLLSCYIILISSLSLEGQDLLFNSISENSGLPNVRIYSFCRDADGFLWIGTDEGLYRFDGHNVESFRHDPSDTRSLPGNNVNAIFEGQNGNLWINAGGQFCTYEKKSGYFTRDSVLRAGDQNIRMEPFWKALRVKQDIWLTNQTGIYRIPGNRNSAVQEWIPANQGGTLQTWTINDMVSDPFGNIWYLTSEGRIGQLDVFRKQLDPGKKIPGLPEGLFRMLVDSDGDFWFFNPLATTGIYFIDRDFQTKIHMYSGSKIFRLSSDIVTSLIEDHKGRIWAGTDHGGITLIDKKNKEVRHIRHDPLNDRSLAQDVITVLYLDEKGFFWIGTHKKGVSYYHPELYKFSYKRIKVPGTVRTDLNDVNCMAEDSQGNIWIGTNGAGLLRWDPKTDTYKHFLHDPAFPASLSSDVIVDLHIDSKDRIWIGTYHGGMDFFDGKRFTHYRHEPGNQHSISDNRIWHIHEDNKGQLWIATIMAGVNVFDPENRMVTEHFEWTEEFNSIKTNTIYKITEDDEGNLWFATLNGLRKYTIKSGLFYAYYHRIDEPGSLSSNMVREIIVDSRGLIWAGTPSGLNIMNPDKLSFSKLYESDGLPSANIKGMLEDEQGNIWVSTTRGLARVEPEYNDSLGFVDFTITRYSKSDGLQGNLFNERATLKTLSGELIFGGDNGLTFISPNPEPTGNQPFRIIISSLEVNGQRTTTTDTLSGMRVLDEALPYASKLTLPHNQNVFSLEFVALNFFHPDKRKYQYRLRGFNNNWIETDAKNRRVMYTNLDPGRYTFEVRADNIDGSWIDQPVSLEILILPPWWKSIWIKLAGFTLFALLIVSIIKGREKSLKRMKATLESRVEERTIKLYEANQLLEEKQQEISRQNQELARHRNHLEKMVEDRTSELVDAIKQVEESDKLKSAFLANMSHEIRTPMNAIVGFASMLQAPETTKKEKDEYIEIINQNCNALLVLINDILDISMIEANQLRISKSEISASHLLEELASYFSLNKKKKLKIEFKKNTQHPDVKIVNDPTRLRQVLSNLIGNAVKYTEEGEVSFGYDLKKDVVIFFVSDTGPGIDEKYLATIFDHFHKLENTSAKLYRGTGLGLSISKRLVNLMGGNIWVESKPGKGSTFFFSLPCRAGERDAPKTTVFKPMGSLTDLSGYTILVAEDDETNYFLMNRMIKKTGASVMRAETGLDAVNFVRENPNLHGRLVILMDIKMPVMDGTEAYSEIRKINPEIPAIAVTAYARESDRDQFLKDQFNGYVVKPVDKEKLLQTLMQVLPRRS